MLAQISPPLRNTSEAGQFSIVYVMLTGELNAPLAITASTARPDEVALDPVSMMLQPSDRFIPYPISIDPVHDWIDDDDQLVDITITYPFTFEGAQTDITVSATIWNENIDHAGLAVEASSLVVNETGTMQFGEWQMDSLTTDVGSSTVLVFRLATRPFETVQAVIHCDPTVLLCSPAYVDIAAANWNSTYSFIVTGTIECAGSYSAAA
jgi:hypothetical protein